MSDFVHPAAGETHLELSRDSGRTWRTCPVHPPDSPDALPAGYCALNPSGRYVTMMVVVPEYGGIGYRQFMDASLIQMGSTSVLKYLYLWRKLPRLELSTDGGRTWESRPVVGSHVDSDWTGACVRGIADTVLARDIGGPTGLVSFGKFESATALQRVYVWRDPSEATLDLETPPCGHTESDLRITPALRFDCPHCLRAELSRAYTELRKQVFSSKVVFDREVCERAEAENPGNRFT